MPLWSRRGFLALHASAILSPYAFAQQPPDEEDVVIHGGVELVNLMATVRGKNGALIKDLQASDFHILEDGKEQPIRELVRESNLPLMLGMLIDISSSMGTYVHDEQRAGARFFKQILRPGDRAFVAAFRSDVEMLQDVSGDPSELEDGLQRIVYSEGQRIGTALYDAIYLSCSERLVGQNERKVLIVLSDGADYGSRTSLGDAIKAAQTAEIMIYSIAYPVTQAGFGGFGGFGRGGFGGGGGASGDSVMAQLADATGGRIFRAVTAANLDKIYAEIEDEVRSQYSISYSPANVSHDGKFHKIEIKMSNRGYHAQARKGYYSGKE